MSVRMRGVFKLRQIASRAGLLRKERTYQAGQLETRRAIIETPLSWLARCFARDRYVYVVTSLEWDGRKSYIIERAERLSYVDPADIPIPDAYSGIGDEQGRIQKDPLWSFNAGEFGERSALTIYGYWINSDLSFEGPPNLDHAGPDGLFPPIGGPFAGSPVPGVVRMFDTEQAAYAYLENINGEKIPAQIRHLAWVAIGISTVLWQWHDEIAALF